MKESITVRSASDVRCYCSKCELEWELTLEPAMRDMDYETAKKNSAGVRVVSHCPFCGGTDINEN